MSLQGRHVLVVEDEPVLAMMLEELLLDAGAQVVGPAASVGEALALIDAHVIEVALLDVTLRHERSDLVADTLRQRGVPYVLATGHRAPQGVDPAVVPVLHKPYRFPEVETALLAALRSTASRA